VTHPAPSLLYVMKQLELAVRSGLDDIVRPDGLTAQQYTALTVLERNSGISSAQLARHSFVTAQSMADMVGTLLTGGLVDRHRDPVDRRKLVLMLTTEGRSLLDRYREEVDALEARMLAGLESDDAVALRRMLLTCRANLTSPRSLE
jgi:DNA-binding MarR family transcriptional regulator